MKRCFAIIGIFLALGAHAFGAVKWLTSYDAAVKLSKKSGKPVLALFTGSDWCPPCKALDRTVFESPTFEKWAADHVVPLMLDFPRGFQLSPELKAQNFGLQAKYGITGYPTVLILDYVGDNMVMQVGYGDEQADSWVSKMTAQIAEWFDAHPGMKAEYERAMAAGIVPKIDKPLHAKSDLRGSTKFELVVDKWLSLNKPDLAGKVVVLELWNTTSDAATKVVPTLSDWAKEFSNDIAVVAVSNETAGPVLRFMHANNLPYYVGIDSDGVMARRLGIGPDPYLLVISPDGIIRWQGDASEPKDALTSARLRQILEDSKG